MNMDMTLSRWPTLHSTIWLGFVPILYFTSTGFLVGYGDRSSIAYSSPSCARSAVILARSPLGFLSCNARPLARPCFASQFLLGDDVRKWRQPDYRRCSSSFPVQSRHQSTRYRLVDHRRYRTVAPVQSSMAAVNSPQHLENRKSISYLSQAEASAIDEELMGPIGFSIDQLMELAGLSVASAIAEVYGVHQYPRVLVICGPGNNGGDGLVASRHLFHFGYRPSICYPKRTDKPIYHGLVAQLEALSVPFLKVEELCAPLGGNFDIIVDAMFGFSFRGKPRPPFDVLIRQLAETTSSNAKSTGMVPVISVDIPSGWDVEEGDKDGTDFKPDMLVSLTMPKLCAKKFKGSHHYLGGRFVLPSMAEKYKLQLPAYPGTSSCVRIGKSLAIDVAALRENYLGAVLLEENVKRDPIKQFQEWFEQAVAAGLSEPNAMTLATANCNGHPSARIVLLKGYDDRGFVWYTNYGSHKAAELLSNPWAALVFFWDKLHRQVRIEGHVEKVSEEESEEYFQSRPRGSQIGAIVSPQSSILPGRDVIDDRYRELLTKYADRGHIPKPDYWGGFRLRPDTIEFWQGRESRLHDRLRFTIDGTDRKTWSVQRLAP